MFPVIPVEVPKSQNASPAMFTAGTMTGADIARSELGLTGEGIKVGVIDTGIDYDHPAFGGSGTNGGTTFPTARVAYGYDFVGDDYNADPASDGYNPIPKPDGNPDDCEGHGTHVAGIVGADDDFKGVAPNVTLGAYRVFGCEGSTDTDIILSAMERAEADGMDVINMSLGAAFETWPQYPTGTAADRLWRNGIVVVTSAGNEGDYFTQSAGSPGVSRHAIGVASYDNVAVRLSEIVFTGTTGEPISAGYLPAAGSPTSVPRSTGRSPPP
nr:S8 family serine peptidase [Tessaracoccus coleopterorum]